MEKEKSLEKDINSKEETLTNDEEKLEAADEPQKPLEEKSPDLEVLFCISFGFLKLFLFF